ncbi:MAG: crotonase/enoyl-CoA hydratase family protein [Sphingobium phenoxybenzoativorans]
MSERVALSIAEGVAQVRLNRPDKMNALDNAMLEAIAQTGETLRARRDIRAVLLSGEGRAFCAGIDIASFGQGFPDLLPRRFGNSNLFQHAAMLWRDLPMPVIAAIHGACFGGGLQIALGADIRIASPDATLSLMEIKWGLVPDMGAFALTRGLVRSDVLRELAYTGRTVGAAEAETIGLVTRMAPDAHAAALEMARTIASRNPDAIRHAKQLAGLTEDAERAAILQAESLAQADILGQPNQREAVAAEMAKRPPRFTD